MPASIFAYLQILQEEYIVLKRECIEYIESKLLVFIDQQAND